MLFILHGLYFGDEKEAGGAPRRGWLKKGKLPCKRGIADKASRPALAAILRESFRD